MKNYNDQALKKAAKHFGVDFKTLTNEQKDFLKLYNNYPYDYRSLQVNLQMAPDLGQEFYNAILITIAGADSVKAHLDLIKYLVEEKNADIFAFNNKTNAYRNAERAATEVYKLVREKNPSSKSYLPSNELLEYFDEQIGIAKTKDFVKENNKENIEDITKDISTKLAELTAKNISVEKLQAIHEQIEKYAAVYKSKLNYDHIEKIDNASKQIAFDLAKAKKESKGPNVLWNICKGMVHFVKGICDGFLFIPNLIRAGLDYDKISSFKGTLEKIDKKIDMNLAKVKKLKIEQKAVNSKLDEALTEFDKVQLKVMSKHAGIKEGVSNKLFKDNGIKQKLKDNKELQDQAKKTFVSSSTRLTEFEGKNTKVSQIKQRRLEEKAKSMKR